MSEPLWLPDTFCTIFLQPRLVGSYCRGPGDRVSDGLKLQVPSQRVRHRFLAFGICLPTVSSGQRMGTHWGFFPDKSPKPSMRPHFVNSSDPHHLPMSPPSTPTPWGLGLQLRDLGVQFRYSMVL